MKIFKLFFERWLFLFFKLAANYLLREPFAKKSSQKQQKNERKANKNR